MGNGISVKANLTGCSIVFLVPTNDNGLLDLLSFRVIEILGSNGVRRIETKSLAEASYEFAKIQQIHGCIPAEQKFLKVTPNGGVIQLFY